jgi:GNAT superfamily N-acetyltransferase
MRSQEQLRNRRVLITEGWKNFCMKVAEIRDPKEKSRVCESILRALPLWFGIEEAVGQYIRDVQSMPMWTVISDGQHIGFVCLHRHTDYAFEIHVMGVLPEHHRTGTGRVLIEAATDFARAAGARYLTVKTLSPAVENAEYKQTLLFYKALGFIPIEEFKTLWNEQNPALMLIKSL